MPIGVQVIRTVLAYDDLMQGTARARGLLPSQIRQELQKNPLVARSTPVLLALERVLNKSGAGVGLEAVCRN